MGLKHIRLAVSSRSLARSCANACFDAGFVCGSKCIEHGSKTDDDDPCQRVCIADARTCFDGCAG